MCCLSEHYIGKRLDEFYTVSKIAVPLYIPINNPIVTLICISLINCQYSLIHSTDIYSPIMWQAVIGTRDTAINKTGKIGYSLLELIF